MRLCVGLPGCAGRACRGSTSCVAGVARSLRPRVPPPRARSALCRFRWWEGRAVRLPPGRTIWSAPPGAGREQRFGPRVARAAVRPRLRPPRPGPARHPAVQCRRPAWPARRTTTPPPSISVLAGAGVLARGIRPAAYRAPRCPPGLRGSTGG
ncbi:hypothetical protein SDC9_107693 [bioreactor metagenome]|uniref:Uncharacterized protein n=1 Tax=bioreactor metagenome TaxID=1076179 RepID=A0A645B5X2_9ZZZZ